MTAQYQVLQAQDVQISDSHEAFALDVLAGLLQNPKSLPSKYFYDEEGRVVREIYTEAAGKGEKRYEYDEEGGVSRESFYRRGRLEKVRIYTGENAWHEEILKNGVLALRVYYTGGEKVREEFIRAGQVVRERAY